MPYCSGTVLLNASKSLLFYRSNGEAKFVDFAKPNEAQLKALADACSPASFGRDQEDIHDESYRKAGKMDTADFCTHFSPWDSGVLKTIIDSLFKTEGSFANVKAELYKLNVYGPGSFFKAHVDTPRSDAMFGSLVVVLPTPHTGGTLLFRHSNIEHVFDSAAAVSTSSPESPRAAFAAFFSDVEHEVAEVISGYRVTLTYNLYDTAPEAEAETFMTPAIAGVSIQDEDRMLSVLKGDLASVLNAPTFLPDGGLLAFELAYKYPFDHHSTQLSYFEQHLKSTDALLKRACDESGLKASLKVLYRVKKNKSDAYCFLNKFHSFDYAMVEDGLAEYLSHCEKGVIVGYDVAAPPNLNIRDWQNPPAPLDLECYARGTEILGVAWAKAGESKNAFEDKYMAYGNEASIGCAYAKVCLVARIKPAAERL
ncbi:hypothetical protein BDN70DRAFT_908169 [Pholiota conissans]|uniref:Fe2OG dioxygenase domain-containing protein n=1 Tax=Pholiota conissans TaxID=109636 RepID=A0A9P5YVC2_9AGAR|nr:hypothetical protein BDN70DRAFT_908169 [Pholiota conissans]